MRHSARSDGVGVGVGPRSRQVQSAAVPAAGSALQVANQAAAADIGRDGRYNFGLFQESAGVWYNISYAWPADPWSSFATVRVDGADAIYGSSAGAFLEVPHNTDGLTNTSLWRKGDVSARQTIQIARNPATGVPDAAQIRYTVTNTGTAAHAVGLRVMVDTMLDNNDGAPFRVTGPGGVQAVTTETDYLGAAVPDFWQAFKDLSIPDISAQYTLRGDDATPPDRMAIAAWPRIYPTNWDFTVNPTQSVTSDSAVGMWWNPLTLNPGQTRTLITYYGRPRTNSSPTLTVSCPAQVTYSDWSAHPINAIAYLNNNTGVTMSGVTMTVQTGMPLLDNDPTHSLGTVGPGGTTQTAWRLQPVSAGLYNIHVEAYQQVNGAPQLIATGDCRTEALAPAVPGNITLTGVAGYRPDGTPVAYRCEPITVTVTYPDPQPVGVTFQAVDAAGTSYSVSMVLGPSGWTATFAPCQVGLSSSPILIQLTPLYPDGSTGPVESFKVVLIDPSGFVYNAAQGTGWRLPGASVTLQYFDPQLQAWVDMSDAAYPNAMSPADNPEFTNGAGHYGWDVAPGQYRVRVSRAGFVGNTSPAVTIPPAVTDLNVGLTPVDGTPPVVTYSGVTPGGSYAGPVTIDLNATDDLSGVRFIAYALDGGAETTVMGAHAAVTVSGSGGHTLAYRGVDQAGNQASGSVSFSIGCMAAPVLAWLPPLSAAAPADIANGDVLPIRFTWTNCGAPIHDESVAIRVLDAASGRLITGYTYGAGITVDDATGTYRQDFDSGLYGLTPGMQLRVRVYFGNKLKATSLVNVH
jgi:hypothetical protein